MTGGLARRRLGMAIAAALALCAADLAHADDTLPLPLSGAAYRLAREAYAAYDAHRYAESIARTREAIRQRPDVVELRLLLANALAASGHLNEASQALADAIAQLGATPQLVARRKQIDALAASGGAGGVPGDLQGDALKAARGAYRAYAQKDYAAAVDDAREAIALAPRVERLHYLLIDALSASGKDADAYAADLDTAQRFGDSEGLRTRRRFIGARIAPGLSAEAYAARGRGDLPAAARLAREAIKYAPDRAGFRTQLIEILLAQNDLAGVEEAASQFIAQDDADPIAWTLRGYARAARGDPRADADFARALTLHGATPRDERVARTIIADVWISEGRPHDALDVLPPLATTHDDTDSALTLRRRRAQALLARGVAAADVDPRARPVFDCRVDPYGASCDVYAADPAFDAKRQARLATEHGDRRAAIGYWREAVALVPDDPAPRVALIDALASTGETHEARTQARALIDAGLLDGMTDVQAAFIAQRAGDNRLALDYFERADRAGTLPPGAAADAGYTALRAHRNREGAAFLERAIDHGLNPTDGETPLSQQALDDARRAHAEATRDWGFNASLNYRGGGAQPGFASNPTPGVTNNWQAGSEVYWRPFGSLGERSFELYARGYDNFGIEGNGPSGIATLQAAFGARAKPFESVNAVFAFERIVPLGSAARGDWLPRLAYSGGFGTELRSDAPSWWTGVVYGEVGHYLEHPSTYATANARLGRTFRVDSVSPSLTVFPYLVAGADYDSTIDHSVPAGVGAGVAARYWFRGGPYDAPRSFVDVSVQYRVRVAGDDRARGVFFGAVFSY